MIKYKEGFKYQLVEDVRFVLHFAPHNSVSTDFVDFHDSGVLTVKKGYAWDGPSGPTFDDNSNLQASCLHDAGYQLMRMGLLDNSFRFFFDEAFKRQCRKDGMNRFRAFLYFQGVHLFGEEYAMRQGEKILVAGK